MKAKTLLGLHDKATLQEIKTRYKALMQQWHPDRHPDDPKTANAMSAKINHAYQVITHYVKQYEYRFDEDHLKQTCLTPQEWWNERFGFR